MGFVKLPESSLEFFRSNVNDIFESGAFAEGPWNKRLTDFAREYCGAVCATPTSSNGAGLMALLQIYRETDRRTSVLLQSNTMYGVKTLVRSAGLEVAGYVDCNPFTLMPDLAAVSRALETVKELSTLVLLLSHIGGSINPEIVAIADLCRRNGVILLEDCAHSFGATYQGQHSGTFGDAGVYSFYATKAVPAGEGGLVVTNNETVGSTLSDFVQYDRFKMRMNYGVNIRLSEVQALLVFAAAKEVDQIIHHRTQIAARYIEACERREIPFIRQNTAEGTGNYYKFIVLSKRGDIAADLPNLRTTTSKVYDYCLGGTTVITKNHACLPIWYGQPDELAGRVITELDPYTG